MLLSSYEPVHKGYTVDQLRKLYSSGNSKLWPKPELFDEVNQEKFQDIGVLPELKNTDSLFDEKAKLGRLLFFDPKLSSSGQIACASCHDPEFAYADGRRVAKGYSLRNGTRNVPTLINIGYAKTFFWDSRAKTLEHQVVFPIENPEEMNTSKNDAEENIKKIKLYRIFFKNAFGDDEININKIAIAISAFERTLVSPKTRFDDFISGNSSAFTDSEVRGLHLFRTKAKCINCHNTPYFSDQNSYNLGLTNYGLVTEDLGLYQTTKKDEDVGRFKTPTLREISRTAPYFHFGLVRSLDNLIRIYNQGMPKEIPVETQKKDPKFQKKSKMIQPLNLTEQEIKDLESFLETLSSQEEIVN